MQEKIEIVDESKYDEAAAWTEISKRVLVFRIVYNLLSIAIVINVGLVAGNDGISSWQQVAFLFFILAIYILIQKLAAYFPNSFRCPDCEHGFLKIDPTSRNPFFMVSFGRSSAICQNCGFMIRNPKYNRL